MLRPQTLLPALAEGSCGLGSLLGSPVSSTPIPRVTTPLCAEGALGAALENLPSMSWGSSSRPAFPDLSSEHSPALPRQRTPTLVSGNVLFALTQPKIQSCLAHA